MTQPPEEPAEGGTDEPWQAPGPPPPPPVTPPVTPSGQYPGYGPPYDAPPGHNPYGGATMSFYSSAGSGGMSRTLKVVLGVLIGLAGGFFLWFVALLGFVGSSSSGDSDAVFFFAAVAPLLVPAPLLIWKATRPWAVGLLMGTAVASIGMSSLCSAMINSFEGGA
jgi:hypothetical protein